MFACVLFINHWKILLEYADDDGGRTHRGAWPKFVRVSKFTVLGAQTSAKFSCLLIILNMIIGFSVAGGRRGARVNPGQLRGAARVFLFVDHVCFDVDYSTNKTMHVVYMLLNGNNKQLGLYCLYVKHRGNICKSCIFIINICF